MKQPPFAKDRGGKRGFQVESRVERRFRPDQDIGRHLESPESIVSPSAAARLLHPEPLTRVRVWLLVLSVPP